MLLRPFLVFSILVSLLGCEAQTTVQTRFVLPSAITASTSTLSQLHVSILSSGGFTEKLSLPDGKCPAYSKSISGDKPTVTVVDGKFTIEQSRIPSVPEFCAAAWFDANSNSDIDSGDATGQFAIPYPVQPSTFLGSNRYNSPDVVLEIVK
jgi:hypothetical protein